jgi:hypothetical protein
MNKKVIVFQLDLYTRIVLTIIAVSLAGLLLKPLCATRTVEAEPKEIREIKDVNIALINGQPPEIASPLRVNIARSKTLGVKIEEAATVPVSIEKSEVLDVNIAKSETLPVSITKSDVLPVNITAANVIDTRVIDSITMPVEIVGPSPMPVVQTMRRIKPGAEGE